MYTLGLKGLYLNGNTLTRLINLLKVFLPFETVCGLIAEFSLGIDLNRASKFGTTACKLITNVLVQGGSVNEILHYAQLIQISIN